MALIWLVSVQKRWLRHRNRGICRRMGQRKRLPRKLTYKHLHFGLPTFRTEGKLFKPPKPVVFCYGSPNKWIHSLCQSKAKSTYFWYIYSFKWGLSRLPLNSSTQAIFPPQLPKDLELQMAISGSSSAYNSYVIIVVSNVINLFQKPRHLIECLTRHPTECPIECPPRYSIECPKRESPTRQPIECPTF